MPRRRQATKAPLAVAGILAMPLFFTALMAMSLAVEKPSVRHALRRGNLVRTLGDPSGATEARIWLLALLFPLAVVLIGTAAIRMGRAGVVVSSLAAVAAAIVYALGLASIGSIHSPQSDGIDSLAAKWRGAAHLMVSASVPWRVCRDTRFRHWKRSFGLARGVCGCWRATRSWL